MFRAVAVASDGSLIHWCVGVDPAGLDARRDGSWLRNLVESWSGEHVINATTRGNGQALLTFGSAPSAARAIKAIHGKNGLTLQPASPYDMLAMAPEAALPPPVQARAAPQLVSGPA